MLADQILERLDGVRRTGPDRWLAKCPAHDDRAPSLSVRDLGDRVLLHCFAGCHVNEITAAVALTLGDLFERAAGDYTGPHRERRPFPASDVLRCVAYEATVAAVAAAAAAAGREFSEADRARLVLAATRLREAVRLAEGGP